MTRRLVLALAFLSMVAAPVCGAQARDAAFVQPGGGSGASDEAVKVDPKPDIDIGETTVGVAKRTSVFFDNESNQTVKIEKVTVNGDANVTAAASADDCSKQGEIAPSSRCSVEVSVTPISPGPWNVDVLMTHNGAGRIARAHLSGKTSGSTAADNKDSGLTVNTKDIKPIDFGDVTVGDGKIVRSTLMVNNSAEPITLYSIDVIEADNGLQRLDQGCAVNMELAPGASCPVTLLWEPKDAGPVSTDLIIRDSGPLGFVVIPIRGKAKGDKTDVADKGGKNNGSVPPPPSAQELEKAMAGKIAPVSSADLGSAAAAASADNGTLHLIGTVGDRAVLLKPDGDTVVVPAGGEFDLGAKQAKLLSVNARAATVDIGGKKKQLLLEAAQSLVDAARKQAQADASSAQNAANGSAMSSGNAPRSVKLGVK
ncbi:MAG: choice-of-anchor D domain-containing protein [Alphaproteobacteria bacterium]|nr:choice-of-anchor D domain-containing protein [Alphaproteobacteria bacterium]